MWFECRFVACVAREEDNQARATIVTMSSEDSFKMRSIRLAMLNTKNWVVWKFQIEQVMCANHLLGILYRSIKRPMEIVESNRSGGTIMKNQKDSHWQLKQAWRLCDGNSLHFRRTGAHWGACHGDIVILSVVETESHLRAKIGSLKAGPVGSLLQCYENFERHYQPVRCAYRSRDSEVAQCVGDVTTIK